MFLPTIVQGTGETRAAEEGPTIEEQCHLLPTPPPAQFALNNMEQSGGACLLPQISLLQDRGVCICEAMRSAIFLSFGCVYYALSNSTQISTKQICYSLSFAPPSLNHYPQHASCHGHVFFD